MGNTLQLNRGLIISWANASEATVGAHGFFGNSVSQLIENIKAGEELELTAVKTDDPSLCFFADNSQVYSLFLPRTFAHNIRPFQNFAELRDVTGVKYNGQVTLVARIHGLDRYYKMITRTASVSYKNGKLIKVCGETPEDLLAAYFILNAQGQCVPCGVFTD